MLASQQEFWTLAPSYYPVSRPGSLTDSLPGLEACTSCDSCSAICGHGKKTAFDLVCSKSQWQELMSSIGSSWEVSDQVASRVGEFV